VWFDTPVLREPAWQSLQILPESYVEKLELLWAWMIRQIETEEEPFKGFKDYELHRLDRDIAWMRSAQLPITQGQKQTSIVSLASMINVVAQTF
jgi:hypothetical protein